MTQADARRRAGLAPISKISMAAAAPRAALDRAGWLRGGLVFTVAALLLLLADTVLLTLHAGAYYVDVGNYRDKFLLVDPHPREERPDGSGYRWTRAHSTIWLTQPGVAPHALLTLDLGPRPAPGALRLTLNGSPWSGFTAAAAARRYTLLLPPAPPAELVVGLDSDTFTVPGDGRRLGVLLDGFALTFPRRGPLLPALPYYLVQLGLLLAAQLVALRLRWPWWGQALALGLLALGLAAILSTILLLAYVYLLRLLIAGAALAAITWLGLPIAERRLAWAGGPREVRLLWALTLGAIIVRLSGALYPTFFGQDIGLNVRRLIFTMSGQLVVTAWSGEFADGRTIYPPGPYLTMMPLVSLSHDYNTMVQGLMAALDGSTALLVALLAYRLGGNRHAARMALILYACNLMPLGTLVYSFTAQIFGQWFTTPIALLLLAPGALRRRERWLLATVLLALAVFSHIGVAILGISWFGLLLGLLALIPKHGGRWTADGGQPPTLGRAVVLFAGCVLAALALLYSHIAGQTLGHLGAVFGGGAGAAPAGGFALRGATPLLWKGAWLAYSEVGLLLLPLGLLLVFSARRSGGRLVPLAWLLTAGFYVIVDLATGLQVRYFYFAAPLALAAIALVLGRLASAGRPGRLTAWALVAAIATQNLALWYSNTLADGQISMTPLTH